MPNTAQSAVRWILAPADHPWRAGGDWSGLLYPRVSGKVAVMSPSVWWDQRSILGMARRFQDGARPRLWLDSGTDEGDKAAAGG
jgi:hypothetical protein